LRFSFVRAFASPSRAFRDVAAEMLRLWDVFVSGTGAEAAGASGIGIGAVSAAADSANSSATDGRSSLMSSWWVASSGTLGESWKQGVIL
jgi:hypothetical protein